MKKAAADKEELVNMRQRSASFQEDAMKYQSDPFAERRATASTRPRTPKVAPFLSLPQRPDFVDSPLTEEALPDETPQPERKAKRAKKPSTQSLVVHTAATSPLDLREPASPADLQLIPRTSPAVPSVKIKQSWFHTSSPRFTFIKLSLIALIVFGVLTATFATAGGNANLLFHALSSVLPFSAPAAQQAVGQDTVAQRVRPIIQADLNAGYDSKAQHDLWWDSACSAAAMAEILHAWGITNVTIGQLIDVMSAHNPPYITSWGGLMSQDAWGYMMNTFNMRATVQMNHGMSYDDLVNMTEVQGIPVVLGIRDSGGMYYPAFSVGHFLVAVGGDANGIRIIDSSLYRITYLPKNELNYLWTGETVVIKPA